LSARAALWILLVLAAGCASPRAPLEAPLAVPDNVLAYQNGLVWEYRFDDEGDWVARRREPSPEYSHRCFAQVRTVRLYFQYARFDETLPKLSRDEYRTRVAEVHAQNPRDPGPPQRRVLFPGYPNLYQFSLDHADLIQEVDGGLWRSYVQRGNWRMVIPFTRGHQARMARSFMEAIDLNRPPVVRLVRFPRITINHTIIPIDYEQDEERIVFQVYDPNIPEEPRPLVFDRESRTFDFVRTDYFPGGRVDAYEIFDGIFF